MKIQFEKNGIIREVKEGFSWTVLFFSAVALSVRGQTNLALVVLFTYGLATFYYAFKANKLLKEKYIIEGWTQKT